MMCEKCNIWTPLEDDQFCSWCGHKLTHFTVELFPARLYVGDVRPIELKLVNLASKDISIEKIEAEPDSPDLRVEPEWSSGQVVEGKGSLTVPINVDAMFLDDGFYKAAIKVTADVGENDARLEVAPEPEFSPANLEYKVMLDESPSEPHFAEIRIIKGAVTVTELAADANSDWLSVKPREGTSLPFVLDARKTTTLPIELTFNDSRMIELTRQSLWEHEGNLVLSFGERSSKHIEPVRVGCYIPPAITVWEESDNLKKVLGGRPEVFRLTIENTDPADLRGDQRRDELRIEQIDVLNEDGSPCPWLTPEAQGPLPLVIQGGRFVELSFAVQTTEASPPPPDRIGIGTHFVDIVLSANLTRESKRSYSFEFKVEPVPTFRGVLAVDFGTSNTCCALLTAGGGGQQKLIEIDETLSANGGNRGTTAPSVIQYIQISENGSKEYQIGSKPADFAYHVEYRKKVIGTAKRYLGSNRIYPLAFTKEKKTHRVEYTPRQVVSDYLRRVKEIAEDDAKARIERFIIAHPSRFSLRQIRDMEQAAREAFGDCKIEKIHEPIGAALDFIITPEACARDRYTLMVYDFGGGTTDITLLEIEVRDLGGGRKEIIPRVLGATGNPRLGGTEVTEIVMNLALKKFGDQLAGKVQNAQVPMSHEGVHEPNPSFRRASLSNRAELSRWAEATKIAMSSGSNVRPSDFDLSFFVNGERKSERFLDIDITPSIVEELSAQLEEFLESGIGMMKDLAEEKHIESPDIILLAGKSSAMPSVKRLIHDCFPSAEILPKDLDSRELKECVVRGACIKELYRQVNANPHLNLDNLASLSATTSKIGYIGLEFAVEKFVKIFGAGVPIPETGLRKIIDGTTGLERDTAISIEENIGGNDFYWIGGRRNPDIFPVETFELRSLPEDVTNEQLSRASLEIEITKDLDLHLRVCFGDEREPILLGVAKSESRLGAY